MHKNLPEQQLENSRRNFIKKTGLGGIAALTVGSLTASASAVQEFLPIKEVSTENISLKPDVTIRTIPENMVNGFYGADVKPVATVKPGQVVAIETINTVGINKKNPEEFYQKNNLPIDEHAQEIITILKTIKPEPSGLRGHILTGPVFIEGAAPGDTLEVQIQDILIRSDYGVNSVWPGGGAIPDDVKTPETFVYRYDKKRQYASFKEGIKIPLKPFFGVMALSPPADSGRKSSIPPDFYGGNLDLKHLVKGTSLFLPVSVPGGLFTTGDCHTAQGTGEVSGVAIEASLTLVAKFVLHKDKKITQPRAETPTHFIAVGLDKDLRQAMKNATLAACNFMADDLGFTFNEALSIASTAVDFEVTQVVDQTVGVHAMIPKAIFTNKKFPFWNS
jgi:acetamidase/formamidase